MKSEKKKLDSRCHGNDESATDGDKKFPGQHLRHDRESLHFFNQPLTAQA